MKGMDKEKILRLLEEKLAEYQSLGDPKEYELEKDIAKVEEWAKSKEDTECPIDLTEWEIAPVALDEEKPKDDELLLLEGEESVEDVDELEEFEDELETLEQSQFTKKLQAARQDLNSGEVGRLLNARFVCQQLAESIALGEDYTNQAKELLGRIQRAISQQLNQILEEGDQAKKVGELDRARQAYQQALRIDEKNQHAEQGLLSIDELGAVALSAEQIQDLRYGLRNREDIGVLENAVRQAEALDAVNRLSPELISLAEEARQAFDQLRTKMGKVTTQARFGSLTVQKTAVEELQDMLIGGQKTVLDPIFGIRPTPEAIDEANVLWEEQSFETVQYLLARIDRYLPGQPHIAKTIYDNAFFEEDPNDPEKQISVPYYEDAKRELLERKNDITEAIAAQEEGQRLEKEADDEGFPVNRYAKLLQAQVAFPHARGLEEKVAAARRTALRSLEAGVDAAYREARSAISTYAFEDARNSITAAKDLITAWPEEEIPTELESRQSEDIRLSDEIKAAETTHRDFLETAKAIKEYREASDKLGDAFRLLDELQQDERFEDYQELKNLNVEMDAYRGVGEQLQEARIATHQGDWERAYRLTEENLNTAKGKIKAEFKALFEEAYREWRIERAHQELENDDVVAANRIITRLLHELDDPDERTQLEERLKDERDRITRAIAATKMEHEGQGSIQQLFERAEALEKTRGWENQLFALRLYRYIGGEKVNVIEGEDWPPFELTLRTSEARQRVLGISNKQRQVLVNPIKEAYKNRSKEKPNSEQMLEMAEVARGIREAGLLYSEEERAAVRWIEIAQGIQEAQNLEEMENWDAAVSRWQELNLVYPRRKKLEQDLRDAKIQQALVHTQQFLDRQETRSALDRIWESLDDPSLSQAWELRLKLTHVHRERGEFDDAFSILKQLKDNPQCSDQVDQLRAEYQQDKDILAVLDQVEQHLVQKHFHSALELLLNVQGEEKSGSDTRIQQKIDQIYTQRTTELMQIAEDELNKNTHEGDIEALVALIDLHVLEDILSVAQDQRKALSKIEPLRGDIRDIARTLVQKARGITMNKRRLDDVLDETGQMGNRLRTMRQVLDRYAEEYQNELKLVKDTSRRIREQLDRLNRLKKIMCEVSDEQLWEDALRRNDFSYLDKEEEIQSLELHGLLEQQHFISKLDEWRAISKYLDDQISSIRDLFLGNEEDDEDFDAVEKCITNLRVRPDPDTIPTIKQFTQIHQAEYNAILEIMSDELQIPNIDGPNFMGWDQVRQAAHERGLANEAWKNWKKTVQDLADKAQKVYEVTNHYDSSVKLGIQKGGWETVQAAVDEALVAAEKEPKQDGETLPIYSEEAKSYQESGRTIKEKLKTQWKYAATKILKLENQITRLGGFPTVEDLAHAKELNDLELLEKLLANGEKIGHSNEEEKKLLRIYGKTLKEIRGNKKNGWW